MERVRDILDAVIEIRGFVEGMDFGGFANDKKTIRAVELNFIIIGEATNAITDHVEEEYPEIPWHLMRGMRNRLVHAYYAVDEELLWNTISNDLPQLEIQLRSLLA